jgi:purine nucleoside phosphorylase
VPVSLVAFLALQFLEHFGNSSSSYHVARLPCVGGKMCKGSFLYLHGRLHTREETQSFIIMVYFWALHGEGIFHHPGLKIM